MFLSCRYAAFLAALFVAAISLPLAANLAGFDGADAAAENRELAPFPRIDDTWPSIRNAGPALGAWFDDHFGFRARLVRWYGESRLFLLGVSPTAAVVKGDNGWFFYGEDQSVEDFANARPMSGGEIANWRDAVGRAGAWLRARGVAYVFAVAPDKHTIYGEYMPAAIVKVGEVSRTDQLYTGLQDLGVAIDVRPSLFEAKARERIYQKTDTHWNDRGAFIAYQRIVNAVRVRVPRTPPAWTREDFDAAQAVVPGMDLAGMMGLTRVLTETNLALVPRRPRRARVVDPVGSAPTDELGTNCHRD